MLTGDAANADPACDKSPFHERVLAAVAYAQVHDSERTIVKPLVFRDPKNSLRITSTKPDAVTQV